jgi:DNA-binding NarL/FixJ family response regulator
VRIVVAEDSLLFREGLVRLLQEAGHTVLAAVGDADELLEAAEAHRPDLVIADLRMPPEMESDGAKAAVRLRNRHPSLGVVLLSQHVELRHCLDLLGAPGFGYLLKDGVLRLDDFLDALDRVAHGGTAVDPEIVRSLVRETAAHPSLDALTVREQEVLALTAEGHTNAATATLLGISERTAESHMRAIFVKLGLADDGVTHRRVRAVLAWLDRSSTT